MSKSIFKLLFTLLVVFFFLGTYILAFQNNVYAHEGSNIVLPTNVQVRSFCTSPSGGAPIIEFSWNWPSNAANYYWEIEWSGPDSPIVVLDNHSATPPENTRVNVQSVPAGTTYEGFTVKVCDHGWANTGVSRECRQVVNVDTYSRPTCVGEEPPSENPDGPSPEDCRYCEREDGWNATFYPDFSGGGGDYCVYCPAGGGLTSCRGQEPAANDGVCASNETCETDRGCVAESEAKCQLPVGQCNDESNAFCRTDSTCTNNYCAVEVDGKLYQWTLAYNGKTGKYGTCRRSDTALETAPGGECTDDSECQANSKCIDGKCEPNKECDPATESKDCWSGKCNKTTFKCEDEYAAYNCRRNGEEFTCNTALGYINTNPERFVQRVLRISLGIAGGVLLVLIILNGYKLMTSQGDPERIKDAREGIIAAIAGVLLIIFSLTLLQLITVDIIGIPGFR